MRQGVEARSTTCQGRGRGFEPLRPLQIFLVIELLPLGCRKATWSPFFRGSVRGSGERDARINDCGANGLKSIFVVEADRDTAELNPYGETITQGSLGNGAPEFCAQDPRRSHR